MASRPPKNSTQWLVQETQLFFAVPRLIFQKLVSYPTHLYAFVFLRLRVVAVDLLVMYFGQVFQDLHSRK